MSSAEEYLATLQLVSETMRAAEIQDTLRIDGAILSEKGERVSNRPNARIMDVSMWQLESKLSRDSALADHINSLVEVVETRAGEFQLLLERCNAEIWCFVSFDDSQCGFEIGSDLLRRLSALSISLVFDIYS